MKGKHGQGKDYKTISKQLDDTVTTAADDRQFHLNSVNGGKEPR